MVSIWSASGTYPHETVLDNRLARNTHGPRPTPGEAHMDEIVCANSAFRYWRCPPQVRALYPRLPNSGAGWRALSQAPFVTDILKTPVITAASTRSNLHSSTRRTIRWAEAYKDNVSFDTDMGFSVTSPLNTLFTMTRSVSQSDLILAMYEFCGWFSVSSHRLLLIWLLSRQMQTNHAPAPISYSNSTRPKKRRHGNVSIPG